MESNVHQLDFLVLNTGSFLNVNDRCVAIVYFFFCALPVFIVYCTTAGKCTVFSVSSNQFQKTVPCWFTLLKTKRATLLSAPHTDTTPLTGCWRLICGSQPLYCVTLRDSLQLQVFLRGNILWMIVGMHDREGHSFFMPVQSWFREWVFSRKLIEISGGEIRHLLCESRFDKGLK